MRQRTIYHAITDFDSRVNLFQRPSPGGMLKNTMKCTHTRAVLVAIGFLAGIIYSLCF